MTNGSSWPEEQQKPMIGTGEGEVPLAEKPPFNIETQTMASDLKSLQESGGASSAPKPYTPQPLNQKQNQAPAPDQKKEEVFNPALLNETPPPPPPQPPQAQKPVMATAPLPPKPPKKNVFKILLIAILVIGIGALIYFFAYPALSSIFKPSPAPSLENQNNALNNLTPPELQTPNETATTSLATTSLGGNNQFLPLNLPVITHTSFFKTPAANVYNIILQAPNLEALRQNTASATPSNSTSSFLGEIVYKNHNNETLALKGIIQLIAPNFFNNEFLNNFWEDATFFFYNSNGRWFGVIMKLKDTVNPALIQDKMSQLQADPDNKNFFLFEEPGEIGGWEDGLVKNKPASLVRFANENAVLSYAWFEKHLLISTNLAGAENAANNLGF